MHITLDQHEAEQAKLAEAADHAGCQSVAEAARLLGLSREAIRRCIDLGDLTAHRAPGSTGLTAPWHIELDSFRALYGPVGHTKPRRKRIRMTRAERAVLLGAQPIPRTGTRARRELLEKLKHRGSDAITTEEAAELIELGR